MRIERMEVNSARRVIMKKLFNLQKKYNSKIYEDINFNDPETLQKITQSLALCAHSELSELVSATSYKNHHVSPTLVLNESKILYESVDVIRYIMAILNLWEIDTDEFERAFIKKDIYLNERNRIDKFYRQNFIGDFVS